MKEDIDIEIRDRREKLEKEKNRENIRSRIRDAQISLLSLQAARLGIEQTLIHLQIEELEAE